MSGLGPAEIVVILFLLFLIIFPFWLSLFLRKRYPNKIWLGLILAFVFLPIGQLYAEGKVILWIILLFICHVIFMRLLGNLELAWLTTSILSSMIMYYRLLKLTGPQKP